MGLVYTIHYDTAFNQLHYLPNIYEKKKKTVIKVPILFNNTSC